MNPTYTRAIATAKRLIDKFGQSCGLVIPAPEADGSEPWRDQRTGEPTTKAVKIAWFPPGRQPVFMLSPNTEIPKHDEIGLLAPGDYEPALNMMVMRGGIACEIVHFVKLAPDGEPLLYTLYIAIRG